MATISELVARIRQAVYGEEVRESIASAIEQVSTDVDESVKDWLDDHPEATTSVEDGSISNAKLSSSLKESLTYNNDINKEFTLTGQKLGLFEHTTTQIQGMTTDGHLLYICGTNGDTSAVVIYMVDPDILSVSAVTLNAYGHPNSADYLNGYLYLTGCMPTATTTNYKKLCIVDLANWSVTFKDVPIYQGWWSMAWLKAYNNKYVLAAHREYSQSLNLYATVYGSVSPGVLGQNTFVAWRNLNLEAFNCDPGGMCQYERYILITDAHLSGVYARNCVYAYLSDGERKATLYLPVMEDNELEDVCVINDDMYTVDYNGNIYKFPLSQALSRDYGPAMFNVNLAPGVQYAYVNENGSETYQTLKTDTYLLQTFRVVPWFFTSSHWITGGSMKVRTGTDDLYLPAQYEGDGTIWFNGTGKSGRALVYYSFKYTQSTPSDGNEYLYTLTAFSCTTHYEGTETTYTDPAEAAAAGYFHGYSYVERLTYEASTGFNGTALTFPI